MKIPTVDEREIRREAYEILARHLPPDKFLRFISQQPEMAGTGKDYVLLKDKLFEGETVESLFAQMQTFLEPKTTKE